MNRKQHDLTFSDDTRNKITIFEPQQPDEKNTLIAIFPAMGVRASFYESFAAELVSRNIATVITDHRGHGNSSIRPSRSVSFGYQEMITIDYVETIANIRQLFPAKKIVLLGHSLGGKIGSLFAGRYPQAIDGLILLTSCSVYQKAWRGWARWKLKLAVAIIRWTAEVLGFYPGHRMGFGGLESRGVIRDWSRQSRCGDYIVDNADFDYEAGLREIKIPVLAISVAGDTLAPKFAVDHLLGKLEKNQQLTQIHLAKNDPRNPGYDHFNWAKNPQKMVDVILDWLNVGNDES